jgi:predicted nucleic acid-binding Zn ribbon protein
MAKRIGVHCGCRARSPVDRPGRSFTMSARLTCRTCGMWLATDDILCRHCGEFTEAEKRRLRYFGLLALVGMATAMGIAMFGQR